MGEGGGEGSTNVRLFVSCQLKIIRGFNKHRRPTKRVGYMAQRSRLLFPPKRKQLQSQTQLLRKLHTWGALFLNFLADRFFPTPLPLKASVAGSSKESRIPKHLQEATLNWGKGFSLRKAVDLEIVLLRQVVRIHENIFSSSFVQDCSLNNVMDKNRICSRGNLCNLV